PLVPAKAGTQPSWIPACAGMNGLIRAILVLPPALPQRFEATPERFGLLGEQAMSDARGALRQGGGAFGAGRRQSRAPMRQRLMRRGEPPEHFEILAAAKPFT